MVSTGRLSRTILQVSAQLQTQLRNSKKYCKPTLLQHIEQKPGISGTSSFKFLQLQLLGCTHSILPCRHIHVDCSDLTGSRDTADGLEQAQRTSSSSSVCV